ncbi:MAG TPA: alpha/beta fold hydrolase [Candidatus Limnocylindrales bacterium]
MNSSADPGGMHVQESGSPDSPAILLIHGAGQSSREWRAHMERLADFHCLAPDLPGHGRSNRLPMPSLDRLVDSLATLIEARVPAGRAHVVGVSWGANLAQALIRRHPGRVDRVVSDGTPVVWPGGLEGALALGFYAVILPFLHTRPVLAMFRKIVDPADLRLASRWAYWRAIRQCSAGLAAAPAAPCPTLLVAGEKERYIRRCDTALAALMPDAEAWYAPGLDHCWQKEATDLHIRMVEAWCRGEELPADLRPEAVAKPAAVELMRRRLAAGA